MSRPRLLHRLMLAWYPRAWRERYGEELLALLADRRSGWSDLPDLLLGALDARLNVRLRPSGGLLLAGPALPPVAPPAAPLALPRDAEAPPYGVVSSGPPVGELSRRGFLRRVLGVGTAILSLEFAAGTLNFLWPQLREGLGAKFRVGTIADVLLGEPRFANGWPYAYSPAQVFLVNVPAAMELATGHDVSITNPSASELLALWRKCPHLGCLVPAPCESVTRYQCRCHQSTYNILGEKMFKGPAERGLDRFAVLIEDDGTIVIDTSQLTRGSPNRGPDYLTLTDAHPWDATCGVE